MPAPTINIGSREKVTGVVEFFFAGQLPKDAQGSEGALLCLVSSKDAEQLSYTSNAERAVAHEFFMIMRGIMP